MNNSPFDPHHLPGADASRPAHFFDAATLQWALAVFGLSLFLAGVLVGRCWP